MKTIAIAKLAASTLVVGATTLGGGMTTMAHAPTAVPDGRALDRAADAARQATKALAKKSVNDAVGYAESAVEWQPRNASYRYVLGQAYLAAGRFQAAEQSFSDALTLDPERERAGLNLALAQAALGKGNAARGTLADYRDKLPATDFGLAMVLAGDPDEAVRVLEFATRAPDANATTRQNLAFAYAMAGKWTNAKVMAVQDLSPDEADARIAQWAVLYRPAAPYSQVAALLGIAPGSDAAQPTRLALAPAAGAPTRLAVAEPAPVTVAPAHVSEPAPVVAAVQPAFETASAPTTATVEPAPVVAAPVAKIAQAPEAPLLRAEPAPIRPVVAPFTQSVVHRLVAPRPQFRPAVMTRPAAKGRYVVQLGAFANKGNAERAWSKISSKFNLTHYDPISGFTKVSNVNFVRLAISGFGTRTDANRLCTRIKQGGGVCFVRAQDNDAPAQWVQRKQRPAIRVASR